MRVKKTARHSPGIDGVRDSLDWAAHPLVAEWAGELATLNRSRETIDGYLVDLRQYLKWLRRKDPLTVGPEDVR
jgi:hypothetical protein